MKKTTSTKKTASIIVAAAAAFAVSHAYSASYDVSGFNTNISVSVGFGSVNITNTPHPVPFIGDWDFDFNGSSVDFSGNLYLGDYSSYTVVSALGSMNGTISYVGANQAVSGTGSWDANTNTLSYHIPTGGANSSIASTYTEVSSSCTGSGNILGNTVCGTRGNTTPEWEGLTLELVFSSDLTSFSGTIIGVETSGSGITANTTTSTYTIEGVAEVPVPAAAWLLGSGLAGLAGIARRRNRKQ